MGNILILGTFDGVHKGHQALFENAKRLCVGNDRALAVLFTRHPAELLGKKVELINTAEEKEIFISESKIGYSYIDFNESIAKLSPLEYIALLNEKYHPQAIVVGRNHTFGRGAKGTARELIKYAEQFGYKVFLQQGITYNGELISSTRIRNCIKNGELDHANAMLGRFFSFCGEVVHGRNVGSKIGFPTANIVYPWNKVIPSNGVYCVIIHINGVKYAGVMNIGNKPTFGEGLGRTFECFVLGGYQGDAYGQIVKVEMVKRIRDEMCFENVDILKKQIADDVAITISYFKTYYNKVKY